MHGINVKKRKGKVRKGKKEKFPKPAKRSAAALIPVLFQLPSGVFKGRSEAFFQGGMVERFVQDIIQA